MRLHHRSRLITYRLTLIFVATFVLAFVVLNIRFVEKNVQYLLAPGTIKSKNTLQDAIRLLPLAQNVQDKPLPDHATLVIDSLGIRASIVFGTPDNNDLVYKQLENGVVHYSSTPKPGLPGTAIVLGHSSAYPWYRGDYGAVFALLARLNVGERFYVQYDDGRTFIFQMREALVFNPLSDSAKLEALERSDGSNIILLSCYPVGTNYKRIAVLAQRVES